MDAKRDRMDVELMPHAHLNNEPEDEGCCDSCHRWYARNRAKWWLDLFKLLAMVGLAYGVGYFTLKQRIDSVSDEVDALSTGIEPLRYMLDNVIKPQVADLSSKSASLSQAVRDVNDTINRLNLTQVTGDVSKLLVLADSTRSSVVALNTTLQLDATQLELEQKATLDSVRAINGSVWSQLLSWAGDLKEETNDTIASARAEMASVRTEMNKTVTALARKTVLAVDYVSTTTWAPECAGTPGGCSPALPFQTWTTREVSGNINFISNMSIGIQESGRYAFGYSVAFDSTARNTVLLMPSHGCSGAWRGLLVSDCANCPATRSTIDTEAYLEAGTFLTLCLYKGAIQPGNAHTGYVNDFWARKVYALQ